MSLVIHQFLADPPHSPDLAPCDFWLFSKITLMMQGNCFDTIPEIEVATEEYRRALTKNHFQSFFRSWQVHWNMRKNS
jgi:hypothetical protein